MKNQQKTIAIILIIIAILIVGYLAYFLGTKNNTVPQNIGTTPPTYPVAQTMPPVAQNGQAQNTINQNLTNCNSNSEPWIKVLSPNGGETYTAGQQITIKWASCNINAGFEQIALETYPHSGGVIQIDTTGVSPGAGTLNWIIPSNIDTTKKYTFYLETGMWQKDGNEYSPTDESDNSFTIKNSAPISLDKCLPSNIKLTDIVSANITGSVGGVNNIVKVTVGQTLKGLNATCNNQNKLIDQNGKEIAFYKLVGCWGIQPSNGQEIMQNQQNEINNLNQQYDVIQMTCNSSGMPIQ